MLFKNHQLLGATEQKTGVYVLVNEDFERGRNDADGGFLLVLFKNHQLLGATEQKTGVYVLVNEDFERGRNDADGGFSPTTLFLYHFIPFIQELKKRAVG